VALKRIVNASPLIYLNRVGLLGILDDRKARLAASTLALRVQGTLAFLLIAKSVGRIAAVRPLLERLRQSGMYLSDHLMQRILKQAGE
jgi:predicted nucleic acid-binding protein